MLKTLRGNARNIDFVLVSSSAPLFLSRSLSFFAEVVQPFGTENLEAVFPIIFDHSSFFSFFLAFS